MTFQRKKLLVLGLLAVLIIVLDQVTKLVVHERFRLGESLVLIPGLFSLTYIRNTGAAFGLLAHADPAFRIPFFVIVPMLALGAITWIFRSIPEEDVKLSTALSLVIGGAIGNLIDRVAYGWVIDFLDFHWKFQYHFPAFNVADMAICVGVGILMINLVLQGPGDDEPVAGGEKRDVSRTI